MGSSVWYEMWHVDRAWRGAVNGIKDKENQMVALVYHKGKLLK